MNRRNQRQRRQLLLSAVALLATPRVAQAQGATKTYRVGVLTSEPQTTIQQFLRELGYVEGRDVVFDIRITGGSAERVKELAADLARLKMDLIVASNPAAVLASKRATTTIPIVMMNTPDPVQLGVVDSLAKPGGNITGTTTLSVDVSIKQLELLKDAVPGMSRVALLWNPDNPWHPVTVKGLRARSDALGLKLQVLPVRNPDAFDGAFRAMHAERAQAVLLLTDPMTYVHRQRLAELAIRNRLPMMGGLRAYAEAGSLMSYWADTNEVYRRAASYVDRILKGGARPGDLPIEQPTKYELIANLRTARNLGITIPQSVLLRADQVIE